MHAILACQICDSPARHELVAFPNDPYLRRLPMRTDRWCRYVVCKGCGFVYQPQMMDEAEMDHLYGSAYRDPEPRLDYLDANRAVALEIFSWIAARTGLSGAGRTVLDIGCATGMFLRPFAQTGWTAVGLDAGSNWIEYGRREFGLDLRSEFFTKDSFPGQRFDLIIFSHVLEHVFDPAPVLAAIREKLSDDGYLFIGTPNVLAPNRKLYPGLFGGDHVRLFSPRTLTRYLRRHGFRAVRIETVQPRGLRVLAVKAEPVADAPAGERDDWNALAPLYRGLFYPERATRLEKSLAALVEQHEPVLEEVCRAREAGRHLIGNVDGEAENVAVRGADGTALWLYGKEGSRARARLLTDARQIPDASVSLMLLLGLGLGHLAEILNERLHPDCRLLIWEADPSLFALALRARDLTALFRSPRVTLHVGPDVEFIKREFRGRGRVLVRKLADPVEESLRHPLYREFDLMLQVHSKKPVEAGHCEPAHAAGR